MLLDRFFLVIGRSLLGLYFVIPGALKISDYSNMLSWMMAKGVPYAEVLLPLTIAMQIGLGILLIVGSKLKGSAILLCGLTLLISFYMHDFWNLDGDPVQAHELQNFVKNMGIAAGLLVLASIKKPVKEALIKFK